VLGHAYRNLRDDACDFFMLCLTLRLSIARVLAVERVRHVLIASQHRRHRHPPQPPGRRWRPANKNISRSHTNRSPQVQGQPSISECCRDQGTQSTLLNGRQELPKLVLRKHTQSVKSRRRV
jgi:hypothetical protein